MNRMFKAAVGKVKDQAKRLENAADTEEQVDKAQELQERCEQLIDEGVSMGAVTELNESAKELKNLIQED